jgi:hypothetical protein
MKMNEMKKSGSVGAALLLSMSMACGSSTPEAETEAQETPVEATETETAETETETETAANTENAANEEAPEQEELAIGGDLRMAEVAMRGVDGEEHTIASVAKEHGTLVIFTCNHCPYAIAWQDRIVEIAHDFADRVGTIAINSNDPEEYPIDSFEGMQTRAEELGMQFPYVVDSTSDVARAYGAEKTPEAFLFDSEGHLVYHGAIDDSREPGDVQEHYLRDALTAVSEGEPIANAETNSVGCSIKFRES